jgi:nucleoside-diphosphate-sugar epimerase
VAVLLERGLVNDDFNVCGNNTVSMAELARLVWSHVNPALPFPSVKAMPVPPSDVRFRVGASAKLTSLTGWKPRHGLDFVIDDTYRYIEQHMKKLAVT